MRKLNDKSRGKIYVVLQFLFIATTWFGAGVNILSHANLFSVCAAILSIIGWAILLVSFVNLGKSLTANPVPLDNAKLKTRGLYSIVRHPIYLGLIFVDTSLMLVNGSLVSVFGFAALITLLDIKARFEERLLIKKFPEYRSYAARVGRLVPGIGKIRQS